MTDNGADDGGAFDSIPVSVLTHYASTAAISHDLPASTSITTASADML